MHGMIWGSLGAAAVAGLAAWAYVENYATRDALAERRALTRELADLRAETAHLEAEWALLNRPSRLRALAVLAEDELGLAPMTPSAFAALSDLPLLDAPLDAPALLEIAR